jgi:hypothetical protein
MPQPLKKQSVTSAIFTSLVVLGRKMIREKLKKAFRLTLYKEIGEETKLQ